jgi:hypothetical protein
MPAVIPTRLDIVLPLIQARLLAALSWPVERVIMAMKDGSHPHNQYLRLWPRAATAFDVYRHGAGRTDTRVRRMLAIKLWTNLGVDEVNSNQQWLTQASLGHLVNEHAIINALENWTPTDSAGNNLLVQGMKLHPVSEPEKPNVEEPEWGFTVQEYDLQYELLLQ